MVLGVKIFSGTKTEALKQVVGWISPPSLGLRRGRQKRYIVTPNSEQVVLAQKDQEFKRIFNQADLALPDGIGLLWAAKGKIKEKISGIDFMEALCQLAGKHGWRVMLLGGKKDQALKAARILSQRYGIEAIHGWQGAIDIRHLSAKGNKIMLEGVNQFQPDLLFVAYGAPWQEKWLAQNLARLKIKVGMVVGGSFDMIIDPSLRPPKIMEKMRLGWFYRFLRQPWRIKRQLKLLEFVRLVRLGVWLNAE
ncbi:WecB/TagA/CpsF family glycosyltransferase [Patescibacteria group bacterium]|nr:WecB/TagA/CpsF family glycosyltransferase [Patescibacteria group bacterium]MBU1931816.1 WecB/TagA/CpsF family glycosyltransferase [Patescibacteria group bacterium]